jgi:SAM-dependent methyltransferase
VRNIDPDTAAAFDANHADYDKSLRQGADAANPDADRVFADFFSLLPAGALAGKEGFELGSGTGRIARRAAPHVGHLHCIEPSAAGIAAARATMADLANVSFHQAGVDDIPLADGSQDFGYSFGVLHHIPDTQAGLSSCTAKLKAGAPFLLYLYYRFDNRPWWFRGVWRASDLLRRGISRLPFRGRKAVTDVIALTAYWPLSRAARLGERAGADVGNWPLSFYRTSRLTALRADALDRFGTALERRFTRAEIEEMMKRAGLTGIRFFDGAPYWMAVGFKA